MPERPANEELLQKIRDLEGELKRTRNLKDRFQAIVDKAPDPVFSRDLDRKYTYVNPAACRLLGRSEHDLTGKTPEEVFCPDDAAEVRKVDERILNGDVVSEARCVTIAGERRYLRAVQFALYDKDGKVTGITEIIRDFTDKRIAEPGAIETVSQHGANQRACRRILIMDDQVAVARTTERILRSLGYDTSTAVDGSQAVAMYRESYNTGRPFDFVILDLMVPHGMGGLETLQELLKTDPNVKAIVSSGYSDDPVMASHKDYGFCGFVAKPFSKQHFAELLSRLQG